MKMKNEKAQKLIEVARLYYEQDKTQSEIAALFQISRPMVSRLLKEAKEAGIVTIKIGLPMEGNALLLSQLQSDFPIKDGVIVPELSGDKLTNDGICKAAVSYLSSLHQKRFGIGWGHIIGNLVGYMEKNEVFENLAGTVSPLIGNSGIGNRNYHSNELIRLFALHTGAEPAYLYAPALVMTEQEGALIRELPNYKDIYQEWERLEVALVNIGNYPSTPDFASAARYGDALTKNKAVGRLLNYYFNIHGEIFYSPTDYSLQVPLDVLRRTRYVLGICSANTKPEALLGALRSGIINHVIATETTIKAAIERNK